MITRVWSALQAAVEYGAVTGQAVSGGIGGPSGAAELTIAWRWWPPLRASRWSG